MAGIPCNFLGLEPNFSRYDDARFAVLPIPYDCAASYQAGARNGPPAIISASQQSEYVRMSLYVPNSCPKE